MCLHRLKHSRPCLFPPTADWAGFSPRTLCFQWVLIIASFTESTQERAEVIKGSENSQWTGATPETALSSLWSVACTLLFSKRATADLLLPSKQPQAQRTWLQTAQLVANMPEAPYHPRFSTDPNADHTHRAAQPPILRNRPHTNELKLLWARSASMYMSTGKISTKTYLALDGKSIFQ